MIKRIDHVSIAVRDHASALRFFVEALKAREIWDEDASTQGFRWSLLEVGDSCLLEVISPSSSGSFLDHFLQSRGDGAHHVTFHVDDLSAVEEHLDACGIETFGRGEPYQGWKELFVHPKHAFGVLLQFAEFDPLLWAKEGMLLPPQYQRLQDKQRHHAVSDVLQLGEPTLRRPCRQVGNVNDESIRQSIARLKSTLSRIRISLGFGRAIAASQLGLEDRILVLDLGDGPLTMINPGITATSDDTTILWDDCFSFPELLVKVTRHRSISIGFLDEAGHDQLWTDLDRDVSGLLQHEVDHLDGILAIDRAVDKESIITRTAYEKNNAYFDSLVDGE